MEIENNNVNSDTDIIGSGSKVFQVFKDSSNSVELVPKGISWAAAFLSFFWLAFKGMYLIAGLIFSFSILMMILGMLIVIPDLISNFVSIVIMTYLLLKGNFHYANHLENNGYKPFLIINADNINHAKIQFNDYAGEPHFRINGATNFGIICLLTFFISFFLPFFYLGDNGVTLLNILTDGGNSDLIGIFVLLVGGIMLTANVDMNIIKTATIIGVCFPLYRFYKIVSAGDIGGSFLQPSFGIGGYLILIGAGIQLYACFSFTNENKNISNTDSSDNENSSDDITEKIEKLSNLKDKGALTEEEFDTKKKELLDRI